jgi:hypothetical protein
MGSLSIAKIKLLHLDSLTMFPRCVHLLTLQNGHFMPVLSSNLQSPISAPDLGSYLTEKIKVIGRRLLFTTKCKRCPYLQLPCVTMCGVSLPSLMLGPLLCFESCPLVFSCNTHSLLSVHHHCLPLYCITSVNLKAHLSAFHPTFHLSDPTSPSSYNSSSLLY